MNSIDVITDDTSGGETQRKLIGFRVQLFRFACRRLPEWDAEDAVQETLMKGFYGLKSLRNPGNLQSWLYAICRNEISNILQSSGREILEEDPDQYDDKSIGQVHFYSDEVGSLINRLNPVDQQLVRLKYLDGLRYRKIALLLGISEPLVKSRLYEARQKLVVLSRDPGHKTTRSSQFKERIMKSFAIMQSASQIFSCLSVKEQMAIVQDIQAGNALNSSVVKEIAQVVKGREFLDATDGILDDRDLATILSLADGNVSKRLFSHLPNSEFLQSVRRFMALPDLIQKENQALRLTTEIVPANANAVILSLFGYIDNHNSEQFLGQVLALLDSGFRLIVLHCNEFRYISATGIASFAKIQNRLSELGGELAILCLADPIRKVFKLLGVERFFSFFSDRQQALTWFSEFSFPESTEGQSAVAVQSDLMSNFSNIQTDLLPLEREPTGAVLPKIHTETENLEICGFFRPSPKFSGDYLQYYTTDRLAFIIKCDASGHTPETAQVMIKTAALFTQTAHQILNPNIQRQSEINEYAPILIDLMERLNSSLAVPDLSGQFAALQILLVDSITGSCLVVNAGDNRLPAYRNSSGMEYIELSSSPGAGLFTTDLVREKGGFIVDGVHLEPGDSLFFITDGLEESTRIHLDENGENLETNQGYPVAEEFGAGRINAIIEAAFSRKLYKLALENVMGQTRESMVDFSKAGGTLRSTVDGLAACEFLFRSYPGNERVLVDTYTDAVLSEYLQGYRMLLEKTRTQLDDGVVYQNLGMCPQSEDLTILALHRKT